MDKSAGTWIWQSNFRYDIKTISMKKIDFIKTKNFCTSKGTIKKVKVARSKMET